MNNNKSTENLIASDGSIGEDEFVPPLNLENKKQTASLSDQSSDSQQNHVNNNLVIDKMDLHASNDREKVEPIEKIPPIPAARKSILPPIASKRNDKEVKNDQNRLRKKNEQNEGVAKVEVTNEQRKCFVDAIKRSHSQSDTENTASGRANPIALASLTEKKKEKTKNQSMASEVNAETTSFISHEEKHENEQLPKHSPSNRSDEELDTKAASNEHLLQVNDSPLKDCKSQKKRSKVRKVQKSKKKNNKKSDNVGDANSKQLLQSPKGGTKVYDFKNVIGIWLHETSAFKFDPVIRQPRVRVSIYDLNEENLLLKSNPLRNAVLNYEPTNVTFIQPILSNHCRFKDTSWIECDWSDELLIINEDIHHIERDHIVIFFEILDIIPDSRDRHDWNGWYSINWAFLRPGDGDTYSNLNKRCTLQLHYYQRRRINHSILDEWKIAKKIKYPGNLSVTVGSYKPELTRSVSLIRPMSVLEEEITGDIYTQGSDDDDEEPETIHGNQNEKIDAKTQLIIDGKKVLAASHLDSRLSGQPCECPNRLMYRHEIGGEKRYHASHEQYGSMIAKFSASGHLLAFHCTTYRRHNHEISIINVNNWKIISTLIGHLNIVYDLEWLNENVLASVSSDRTAIVWFLLERGKFTLKILPHPSFVYTVKWLHTPYDYVLISTGGRDCILRIWKMSLENKDDDIELCSELIQHDDYITSLFANRKSSKLYSADWAGVLLEWSRSKMKSKREHNLCQSFQLRRRMKVFPTSILRIELHPTNNRIFVQCLNDPLIYVIDITSAIVTHTIGTALSTPRTFTISPCGTFIFTNATNEDRIQCIRISDAKESTAFRLPISLTSRKYLITSITFHPTKNIIACTVFGSSMHFCLYLMYHDNGSIHEKSIGVDVKYDMHSTDYWHRLQSKESAIFGSGAFEAILHRIDELFCIAIQSPKHFTDYEQMKRMQMDLEKLQQPLQNLNENGIEMENAARDLCGARDANDSIKNFESKHLTDRNHVKNMDSNDVHAQSSSSHQTYTLDTRPQHTQFPTKSDKKDKESDKSSQTYSICSERSNLTFDVHK